MLEGLVLKIVAKAGEEVVILVRSILLNDLVEFHPKVIRQVQLFPF
ncbi:MAG: hypothetical protein S4CHLAM102_11370 [Chlamydiia bacterium]|nr:hypothetical protein [Chlamydiia bacterium]